MCQETIRQLEYLLNENSIVLAFPIQYRTKKISSILNKIDQGRFTIKKSVSELQDLAGLRLITLFKRDSKTIVDLIESNFEILKTYDTNEKLADSEFGYSSTHIICKIKSSWTELPTFRGVKDLKIEIQIRTLSQHSWAEASNLFQYKNELNTPKQLKRSISRISALLETVDFEFERLLVERSKYIDEVEATKYSDQIQELNVDILVDILSKNIPSNHRTSREVYSELLDNLVVLGFTDSKKLIDLISNNLQVVLEINKEICNQVLSNNTLDDSVEVNGTSYFIGTKDIKEVKKGIYFTESGLIREMLSLSLGESWYNVYKRKK
ncbi:GTP pyrophosphokinase YjbM [compost metagenome]